MPTHACLREAPAPWRTPPASSHSRPGSGCWAPGRLLRYLDYRVQERMQLAFPAPLELETVSACCAARGGFAGPDGGTLCLPFSHHLAWQCFAPPLAIQRPLCCGRGQETGSSAPARACQQPGQCSPLPKAPGRPEARGEEQVGTCGLHPGKVAFRPQPLHASRASQLITG